MRTFYYLVNSLYFCFYNKVFDAFFVLKIARILYALKMFFIFFWLKQNVDFFSEYFVDIVFDFQNCPWKYAAHYISAVREKYSHLSRSFCFFIFALNKEQATPLWCHLRNHGIFVHWSYFHRLFGIGYQSFFHNTFPIR